MGPSIDGLEPLRTGETGVQTPERNRYVRDVSIEDHGRQSLQVRITGGTHSPSIRPVTPTRQYKVNSLAPGRLDHRHADPPRRYRLLDLRTNRALRKGGETLAYKPDGFQQLTDAHQHACPSIPRLFGRHLRGQFVVRRIGVIDSRIDGHRRSSGWRAHRTDLLRPIVGQHAHSLGPGVKRAVPNYCVANGDGLFFHLGNRLEELELYRIG